MPRSIPLLCTSYLPPIAYMAVLAHHDFAIIERCETFPKQTLRNRCIIATANGKMPLTVPVVRINGNHTLTADMQICYHENWQTMHWRAICSAYNSAPYFLYYKDPLEKIFATQYNQLLDMNQDLLIMLLKMLKIECRISTSEDFYPIIAKDKKPTITDGKKTVNANGKGFVNTDDKDNLHSAPHVYWSATPQQRDNIIDLRDEFSIKRPYSSIDFPTYSQVFDDKLGFMPNLSILDLIYNLGPEAKSYLQKLPDCDSLPE